MSQNERSSFARLMEFAAQCRGKMAVSVLFAILGAVCGMVPYFAASDVIVRICTGEPELGPVAADTAIALAGYLGSVWLGTLSTVVSHRSAYTVLRNVRMALADKLSRVPLGVVTGRPSGSFKTLIMDTVEKLELPLAHMIPELTANLLVPILIFAYMFYLDWRIALVSLATIPLGIVCYMGMLKDYEARYARVLAANKNMDAAVVEYVGGIQVIKTFNQNTRSYEKYMDAVTESRDAKATWFAQTNKYYVPGVVVTSASLLSVLPLGAYLYMTGGMAASTLITCIILSLGLVKPLIQALRYTDSLAMVDSTVKEVSSLLEIEEMDRPSTPVEIPDCRIVFDHVSFGYGSVEVLHDVTFAAAPRGITALVGPSGSGKSTVARLIASFWEASGGTVSIGGVDVRKMPLDQVMDTVSYVTQDNYLFNVSLAGNIRMGRPDATDEEVREAARKARCHDFISELPDGYTTLAGDAGGRLSGGERQRVAIARAILKDSPIVLLDEATAFTDPENEVAIQQSISELVEDKVLIVIAHHLSTIVNASTIVVLDDGRVSAQGTHTELLENSPLYRGLWAAQSDSRDEECGVRA